MGQVWTKANFDGINVAGHLGGRGSVLAVTAQNPGPDGRFGSPDDLLSQLNAEPVWVSIDANAGPGCADPKDRVRSFYSFHPGGGNFVFGDGSVRLIKESISPRAYRALSTISGREHTATD